MENAAEGIVAATENDKPAPVNIGSEKEVTIKKLVETAAEITGFKGQIIWDASGPNGRPRGRLDITRAKIEFGFEAKTDLTLGLQKTI